MAMVWHVEATWEVDVDESEDNSDRDADYVMLVGGLGGQICSTGDAQFRRYQAAEICAHSLRQRFGLSPRIRLAPSC
jgi:hypothetical protein